MRSTTAMVRKSTASDATRVHEIKSLPYKPVRAKPADIKKAVKTVIRERRAAQVPK